MTWWTVAADDRVMAYRPVELWCRLTTGTMAMRIF
jgi:hypothetical protein